MAWDKQFLDYKVALPDGNKVKVYGSNQFSVFIYLDEPVASAMWQGDAVIVVLKSGKVRKYTGPQFYMSL